MKQFVEVVTKSLELDPIKHVTAMTVASVGAVTDVEHSLDFLPEWVTISGFLALIGAAVGIATLIKAYYEIRLIRINIKKAKD